MKNKRSCAAAYAVREVDGIVFLWGESGVAGDEVFRSAQSKKPMQMEELTDPVLKTRVKPFRWTHRDLPYGWDIFFEVTAIFFYPLAYLYLLCCILRTCWILRMSMSAITRHSPIVTLIPLLSTSLVSTHHS